MEEIHPKSVNKVLQMEYNTARGKLVIPEYGRTVQNLAEYICKIEDREERLRAANALIHIMSQVNPQPKEQGDPKQKLWHHLYVLTNFKLDVDSPFGKPEANSVLFTKAKPIVYAHNRIKYRHYGKTVEEMLKYASTMEEGPEKTAFSNALASYMKMAYWMWNNDKVPDSVVLDNIREMTNGKVDMSVINEFAAHTESYQGGGANKKKDFKQKSNFKNNLNNRNKNNKPGNNRSK